MKFQISMYEIKYNDNKCVSGHCVSKTSESGHCLPDALNKF